MIIYFNNKFSNNKNILIDVRDRGFLLGDAIFETILFNNQKIILFNYHYERFIKSIKKNYFNFSISKKKLEDIIYKLVKRNKIDTRRVAIRLTLSR
jgi:branched-chain amino acid aminotransferase